MKNETLHKLNVFLFGIVITAALFTFAVIVILVTDYSRLKSASPLSSPIMVRLRDDLRSDPDNDLLKEQIRDFDHFARKTYFTTQSEFRSGILILAFGVGIFLIALRILIYLNMKIEHPSSPLSSEQLLIRFAKARFYLTGGALWLLAALCVIFFIVKDGDSPIQVGSSVLEDRMEPYSDVDFENNWPGFRGFCCSGKVTSIPTLHNLSDPSAFEIHWKSKIPLHGYSSPVVWNGKIFLTGGDRKARKVFCFSADDGELIWEKTVPFKPFAGGKLPKVTEDTGFAASTMTTDGRAVFAIFATGDLVSLSFDGELLWSINTGIPENHYAYSSSLLFFNGMLIVQKDNSEASSLTAFNPQDGSVIWENKTKEAISWASPIVAQPDGMIIIATSEAVIAYSADSGKILWRNKCMEGEVAPSPAYSDGMIFMANDNASSVGLDAVSGKLLWKYEDYDVPDVASILASHGKVYLAASYGPLSCLDAETGKVKWVHEYEEGFYSSPILVGDKIFIFDLQGNFHVIQDADSFSELASVPIGEPVMTTPAFADGRMYIRGENGHLFCITLPVDLK